MEHLKDLITSRFPNFKKSSDFVESVMEYGVVMNVSKGEMILNAGEYIRVIPLLIDGLIKIYREDDNSNEILLYYINAGESCVMSITTSLKNEKSSIKALVEEDSVVLAVPKDDFLRLLSEYDLLHTFTYDLFNSKYMELINSIDSLAFSDTKSRLYKYLKTKSEHKQSALLEGLTHREMAKDLSTSREVVSRLLYSLKKDGKINLVNKGIKVL